MIKSITNKLSDILSNKYIQLGLIAYGGQQYYLHSMRNNRIQIVIELGGTSCRVVVVSNSKKVLSKFNVNTTTPVQTMEEILVVIFGYTSDKYIERVSISSFGPIHCDKYDPHQGKIRISSPKVEWRGFNVIKYLRDSIHIPIDKFDFELDVNGSAMGECLHLSKNLNVKIRNMAQIVVGTGVGVGMVINGQIHRPKQFQQEGGHVFANALCLHDKLDEFVKTSLKDISITSMSRESILNQAKQFNANDAGLEQQTSGNQQAKERGIERNQLKEKLSQDDPLFHLTALNVATLCHNLFQLTGIDQITIGGGLVTSYVQDLVIELVVILNNDQIDQLSDLENVKNIVKLSTLGDYNTIQGFHNDLKIDVSKLKND